MPENPDLNDDISVGVTLPFDGDQLGGYNLSKTTLQQASSNIKNLLLTMKGERPMQPTFGSDLFRTLFEPMVDGGEIEEQAEIAINEAMEEWLPYIKIESLDFTSSNDEKDRNIFKITMVFSIVGDPNRFDELTFTVEGSGD